jgi:hypothetical protein
LASLSSELVDNLAEAAPPPPPWKLTIKVDGVEQPVTTSNNGTTFTTST